MSRYDWSWYKIPERLVAAVLVLAPFYAFLSVWFSSFLGHYTLLRLVPESILLVLAIWAVVRLSRSSVLRTQTIGSILGKLVLAYLVIAVLMSLYGWWQDNASIKALFYGLLLITRPVIWFAVVWVFAIDSAWLKSHWQKLVAWPLLLVASFAIVQFLVLPSNFLSHFGYEAGATIVPAQTINQDTDTIRAQSTLRGPNPLGAYLAIGIGLVLVMAIPRIRKMILVIASLLALLVSFSRSAWLGMFAIAAVTAVLLLSKRQLKRTFIIGVVALLAFTGVMYSLRNNDGLQNLIYHSNENSTATETSNQAHADALSSSLDDIASEPLGRGPGTAGPASVYNLRDTSRNSESYFLNIGQELGWLGLGVFLAFLIQLGRVLYKGTSRLSRGILATLLGLGAINMLSYAWADPTLVYFWWGLAGLAVATIPAQKRRASHLQAWLWKMTAPLRKIYQRRKPSKKGLVQFIYFNLGGVVFFVAGYAVFVLLYGVLGWHWLIAKLIADLVGWSLNYLVQHYLAFRTSAAGQGHKAVLKKFIPFSLANVLIDYGIVGGLNWLGISPFIGLWVSSLFFTVWKWLWYKHWIFRSPAK